MKVKVLIVDDTILYRKIINDILVGIPNVEVVGMVNNGKTALSRIVSLKPDLLTLDVEMPIMNGLQVLEEIQRQQLDVQTVMISSKTQRGSEATIKALELGAFDFIAKPDTTSLEENTQAIKKSLQLIIQGISRRLEMKRRFKPVATAGIRQPTLPVNKKPQAVAKPVSKTLTSLLQRTEKSDVIAIGVSTGGPKALGEMLPKLPGDINIPILVVQHMPEVFTASLARSLNAKCALNIKEAENGETVQPNTVYIAAGGKQMKIASGTGFQKVIRITDDPPENNCKPSVDYLFRSVAREYGAKSTCVIMTGMGADGKLGVTVTRASGSFTIAQDEESCVVYGMPKMVVEAGLADVVAPLGRIAEEILKTL